MFLQLSEKLIQDLVATLDAALGRSGIVNIPDLAEQIRQRNAAENVALEDIEAELMRRALVRDAPMEFAGSPMSA